MDLTHGRLQQCWVIITIMALRCFENFQFCATLTALEITHSVGALGWDLSNSIQTIVLLGLSTWLATRRLGTCECLIVLEPQSACWRGNWWINRKSKSWPLFVACLSPAVHQSPKQTCLFNQNRAL